MVPELNYIEWTLACCLDVQYLACMFFRFDGLVCKFLEITTLVSQIIPASGLNMSQQKDDTLRGAVVRSGVWKALEPSHRVKWKNLSVQWAANKKSVRNKGSKPSQSKGISLEMLEEAGVMGADASDPLCNKFIADLIDCQSELVAFVRGLDEMRTTAHQLSEFFKSASTAGKLVPLGDAVPKILLFFEALNGKLDLYTHCPTLAPEHVVPME
jgi:hypothetical protein